MKRKIPAAIRLQVLTRDNNRCRACGFADIDHLEADHIVPESLGGSTTLDNLATLCGACNRAKGDAIVTGLPILPVIEGFGDFQAVKANRESFKAKVADSRKNMLVDAARIVRAWKSENIPASVIRHRIPSLVGNRNVQKVIFEAFRDDIDSMKEMAE